MSLFCVRASDIDVGKRLGAGTLPVSGVSCCCISVHQLAVLPQARLARCAWVSGEGVLLQ